jgi:hypothetical protein
VRNKKRAKLPPIEQVIECLDFDAKLKNDVKKRGSFGIKNHLSMYFSHKNKLFISRIS